MLVCINALKAERVVWTVGNRLTRDSTFGPHDALTCSETDRPAGSALVDIYAKEFSAYGTKKMYEQRVKAGLITVNGKGTAVNWGLGSRSRAQC